jgi:mannosyltransferase OCH1-like enzyme
MTGSSDSASQRAVGRRLPLSDIEAVGFDVSAAFVADLKTAAAEANNSGAVALHLGSMRAQRSRVAVVGWMRFLFARFIKIIGNFLKGPCYLFHFLFPHRRFTIPRYSRALIRTVSSKKIPKVIWQTNHTDRVTLAVYLNYLFNRLMSSTYEYRFMDDTDMATFIKQYCSSRIVESYLNLQIGAARSDLWRLLVLQHFGGVYLDIDAHVVWPMEFIIKPGCDELYLQHKNDVLSNYFLASTKGNMKLDLAIDAIVDNIEKVSANDVAELTGPGALNRALIGRNLTTAYYKTTSYQGTFTNEFFQYIDHPQGKWSKVQKQIKIVRGAR